MSSRSVATVITAAEIEKIVQKNNYNSNHSNNNNNNNNIQYSVAATDLKELFNSKLAELQKLIQESLPLNHVFWQ